MSLFSRARPFLPDKDYLPVAMPTTDIAVLNVLAEGSGVLRRYSRLDNVMLNVEPLPEVRVDAGVVDATGTAVRSAKAGIGLSVVSQVLQALGADATAAVSTARARTVEYAYSDVSSDAVDLVDLDRWLGTAEFDPTTRATADLLAAEDLYVVVNLLKARGLSVRLVDEHSRGIELKVSALQETVGANVTVSQAGSDSSTVTFRGPVPLGVAVKATRIQLDDHGFYLGSGPRPRGEVRPLNRRYAWLAGPALRFGPG